MVLKPGLPGAHRSAVFQLEPVKTLSGDEAVMGGQNH